MGSKFVNVFISKISFAIGFFLVFLTSLIPCEKGSLVLQPKRVLRGTFTNRMMPKILEEFRELDKLQKTSEIISKFEDINKRETPISEEDFNKISFITAKAFFLQGNLEETLKIISPIISWGKKHDFNFYISLISLKATCFTSQGHFKLAQELYQDLFSENEKVTESSSYPSLIANYAHCLLYQGDIIGANKRYLKALQISRERGLPDDQILSNLSLTYNQLGEYEKAIETAKEVILKKEEKKDWHGWVITKVNLSIFYSYLEKYEEANICVDQALKFAENKLFQRELAGAYSAKGAILIREKKIHEAYEYLKRSRKILESIGIKDILPETLVRLGFVTLLLEHYEETKEVISVLGKIAEEQESYFYTIWSACLEALLYYDQEKTDDALEMIDEALKTSLDLKLFNVYFQSINIACYIYASQEKFENVEKILENAREIALDQNSETELTRIFIGMGFLYTIFSEKDKIIQVKQELLSLQKKNRLYTKDMNQFEEFCTELMSVEDDEQKQSLKNRAIVYLIDFLQRSTLWF